MQALLQSTTVNLAVRGHLMLSLTWRKIDRVSTVFRIYRLRATQVVVS